VRVLARTLADQSLVFEPAVTFLPNEDIFILIKRKTQAYDTYTNSRIRRSLPAVYLFCNADLPNAKSYPFLTNNVPVQDISFAYEQGELSLSGIKIQEYYRSAGADLWRDVSGAAFANESDRLLLPLAFQYSFPNTSNLTQVSFTLTDILGNEVTAIDKSDAGGLKQSVGLDFSAKVKAIAPDRLSALSDAVYTLKARGNNGFTATHTVVFSNDLTSTKPWGVIALRPNVTNNSFNLLAGDGFLFRRRNASGVWTEAPVFEIPVKSRLAYWRFINNKSKALDLSIPLTDYVKKEGKVLVTLAPRATCRSFFHLKKESPPATQYVPNPIDPEIKLEADRRLFFDVVVPESDLFPIIP
jgi:hypothetical protein